MRSLHYLTNWIFQVLDVALEVFRDGGNKTLDIPVHDSKMPTLQSQQA